MLGRARLAGKVIVDPTNPVGPDGDGGYRMVIGERESSGQILAGLVGAENVCHLGVCAEEAVGPVPAWRLVAGSHAGPCDDFRLVGLKLIFLIVTRAVSVLGLSRREAWWKDAGILMLRHQLAVALRGRPRAHSRLTWPDRARQPARPGPGRHGASGPVLGRPAGPEPAHGPGGAGARVKFVRHDRDARFTRAFDAVFQAAGMRVIRSAVQAPRMNSIMERWIGSCRRELPGRTLIWNQRHLMMVLRGYEDFCNSRRPHRALNQAAPLRPLPDGVTGLDHFRVRRPDRAGGVIHEYHLVA